MEFPKVDFPKSDFPKLDPLPPMSDPFERSESRSSRRREERYHRSMSRSGEYRNGAGEYRVDSPLSVHRSGSGSHLLRPAEELGGGAGGSRERQRSERSVRIERQAYA